MSVAETLANPIISSPYDAPEEHFELGPNGPTGVLLRGRRPSESFIPLPASRKGRRASQEAFDFDATGERRERNTLINDIRREVERWRAHNWNGVTPYTHKLLAHWAPGPHREDPVLFCQREAAETAIFLAEVAGRHGTAEYRRRVILHGVDVYDPNTGEIRSDDTGQIALWMIDTEYNDGSFFVRECYVTGGQDPYARLKRALKAEIDGDAWASLYRTESRPFRRSDSGKIAVKVINDYGDEEMKVFEV